MPAEFESFCESQVGEFIESLVGARGCVFSTCPEDPPDTYACCWASEGGKGCIEGLTPRECEVIGGRSLQPQTTCTDYAQCDRGARVGACLAVDSNGDTFCRSVGQTRDECENPPHLSRGTFLGVGSHCPGTGSCCNREGWGNPFQTCIDTEGWDEAECGRRATFAPPGVIVWGGQVQCWFAECFNFGKCCSRSGVCKQEHLGICVLGSQFGIWLGFARSCTSQAVSNTCPGSCCLGCGRCVDYIPKDMCEQLGVWVHSRTRCGDADCTEGPLLN